MDSPITAFVPRCMGPGPTAERHGEDSDAQISRKRQKCSTNPFNTLPPDLAASSLEDSVAEEAEWNRTAPCENPRQETLEVDLNTATRRVIDPELGMQDAGQQYADSLTLKAVADEMQTTASRLGQEEKNFRLRG